MEPDVEVCRGWVGRGLRFFLIVGFSGQRLDGCSKVCVWPPVVVVVLATRVVMVVACFLN